MYFPSFPVFNLSVTEGLTLALNCPYNSNYHIIRKFKFFPEKIFLKKEKKNYTSFGANPNSSAKTLIGLGV